MSIKLLNAAIDISRRPGSNDECVIIRGVIDPASYSELKVDTYQREIGSSTKISQLAEALKKSVIPDIELGMRGSKIREVAEPGGGKTIYLQDSTFIIDGLQRITGARYLIQQSAGSTPRIGCLVHLDTTFDWERERFRILNQERSRVSVNILLRNSRHDNPSVEMLYQLCEDKSFAMCNRITWAQKMARNQISTALLLCKISAILHSRFAAGGRSNQHGELTSALNKMQEIVGPRIMRENIKQFFALMDQCFGLTRVVFSHGAPQIKGNFLISFADVLTRHEDFWDDKKLSVSADLRRKIAMFPYTDPQVATLATGNGKAKAMLMILITDHINSGKRTRRLTLSPGFVSATSDEQGEDVEEPIVAPAC